MSGVTKSSLETVLPQLKCHFTWNLFKEEGVSCHLEGRVWNQIESLNTKSKATMYNLLAYIKHLDGQNEAALECLQKAEESIKEEHDDQAKIRSLVTWGNYAWVYYYMGRFSDAQTSIDKVKDICKKFSNPLSIECPEIDCEEGWTRLKCGRNDRAKVCFERALEKKPNDSEISAGLAIAMYHLDEKAEKMLPVEALKQAIELSPDVQYLKILLALKLQRMNEETEAEEWVKEALSKAPNKTDVLRSAANFYRKKGDLDKAVDLFQRALASTSNNDHLYYYIMFCYKEKAKQMQKTGVSEASRDREKVEELRTMAVDYIKKILEKKPVPPSTHSAFTEFLEAERYYKMAFSKELPSTERQQLYLPSHLEDHSNSEVAAVQDHFHSLSISQESTEKEEMENQLQNTAEDLPPQNAPDYWYRQGLRHKQNGDLLQALGCYEKQLCHLLRDSPSGIGSLFLSASESKEDSEDMYQGAGSSAEPPRS